ncbi:GM19301 [Drosophila sechellia]|uniref:GM19301 n=1 Tax=Drosophila sechellia TaxID=7238 RepID=B4IN05_DROSE|nr:GM19301 [Drosophila sechellia]
MKDDQPVKPRMELQAARPVDTVKQAHAVPISSCVLWYDTKNVLHRIRSNIMRVSGQHRHG